MLFTPDQKKTYCPDLHSLLPTLSESRLNYSFPARMSQKQNKKNAHTSRTTPPGGGGHPLTQESERIYQLIEGRHSKAALQLAKDLHKRAASAESEALLVHAYKARIDDLLKLGLSVEAKALLGIVRERFPAAAASLEPREILKIEETLEAVVAPLLNPNLPAEERGRIENLYPAKGL